MICHIFIQARMSSKRLPGKVLLKINNKTILDYIVLNLKKIKFKKKNNCFNFKK